MKIIRDVERGTHTSILASAHHDAKMHTASPAGKIPSASESKTPSTPNLSGYPNRPDVGGETARTPARKLKLVLEFVKNGARGDSLKDQLLVQFRGMFAEMRRPS